MTGRQLTCDHPVHPTHTEVPNVELAICYEEGAITACLDQWNEIHESIVIGILEIHLGLGRDFQSQILGHRSR